MKYYKIALLAVMFLLLITHTTVAQLKANFTADKSGGCSPVAISFTNTSTGASPNAVYSWNLGNGNTSASLNAAAIYKEEQSYTVTLIVTDGGQSSSSTQNVTVYNKPQVSDITVSPVKGCLPLNANFTASATAGSGSISTYLWDFGDGNTQQGYGAAQQHVYNVAQKATVSLTVTNSFGCTNTLQKKDIIEIIPAINASFSASQTILCREIDAVQFTNSSYGPGTLSYLWNFGDGTTSTAKAPSHSFNKKGIYTVTLTVTSSEGCVISSTQAGYINVASFSSDFTFPALVCKNAYVNFNSNSFPYSNSSNWDVDGVPAYSYSGNLNYTFNTAGNHTIKLKNMFGTCPDSVIKIISVKDIPYPNGFVDTILGKCGSPVSVQFKDTTAGAVLWKWNFTNYYSNPDALTQSANYNYTSDANYYVSLNVTNADGCSATTGKYIGITHPYVYVTATGNMNKCEPVKMIFTANSMSKISTYNWNFGDGTTSTDRQPEHLFSNPGSYPVTLTYTTDDGCSATVSYGSVRVYEKPMADFSGPITVCGNSAAIFGAVQRIPDNNYIWNFGDGTGSGYSYGSSSISHQYNYDSTYTVTLIVTNGSGCSDTVTKKDYIKVLPPFPKIASAVNTCDNTRGLVSFTQASKKGESFTWNFGDGNSTTLTTDQPSVNHLYTKTGTYTVTLTVTNGQCSLTDATVVRVLLKQNPIFTTDRSEICAGETFGFQINNIEANPYQASYYDSYNYVKWQYDNGSDFNGTHTYNNYPNVWYTNTYGTATSYNNTPANIRVVLKSAYFGCNDTSNFVPVTFKGAVAGFQIVADKQCWRLPVVLQDTSKASGSSKIINWAWNFGDGTIQNFTQGGLVNHAYTTPGSYNLSLTITDAGGCRNTITSSKYVEVNGPKAAFTASTYNTTITLPVYFYNSTNNYNSYNTQYQWDFGDGVASTDFYPNHAYTLPGVYKVRLIAINPSSSCTDTAFQTITVLNFNPAFSFSNSNVSGKCPPVLVRFNNTSYNYTRVAWDFGDGITADNLNYPSHVYEQPGKYIVTLFVYGPSGLKATYIDSVIVKQPAAALRVDTTDICIDGKINFAAGVSNTVNYAWDFGDGLVQSTADSAASHVYHTAGIYQPAIMVTDANGCSALNKLNQPVNVHPSPVVNFSPAHPVVCKGSSVQITASGGAVYQWTPATGLDNPVSASPQASPTDNITYTVQVKDNIGCSSKADVNVIVAQPFKMLTPPNPVICFGKSVLLSLSGANNYTWINNTIGLSSINNSSPVASPLASTQYTVTGRDQYNCFADTASIKVTVIPLPTVNAGPDQEVQLASAVQLSVTNSSDVVQWNWSPDKYLSCTTCPSPVSTPMAQMNYVVTVANKNGCLSADTVIIKVQCEESTVRIPNAFTPNNDNNNDLFVIKGISLVKHLVIYGRWGEKIFERSNFIASDRSNCWDGTNKGIDQPAGSYVYYAEMQCPTGGVIVKKGTVVLIR